MNLRTIRRPVHNESAAFEAIVRQPVAERAVINLFFFRWLKIIWFSGCAIKTDRYYDPPCSKQSIVETHDAGRASAALRGSKNWSLIEMKKSWTWGLRDSFGSLLYAALFETEWALRAANGIEQIVLMKLFYEKRLTPSACLISCPPLQRKSRL